MKKTISLLLALVLCLSLCACGSAKQETGSAEKNGELEASANSETQVELMSKEDMLSSADPLTRDEVDKSINNIAFAKSLIGNVYTFAGNIWSVEEDHAVITFYIQDENGKCATEAAHRKTHSLTCRDAIIQQTQRLPKGACVFTEVKTTLCVFEILDCIARL